MTDPKSSARDEAAELASNIRTASQNVAEEHAQKARDAAASEVDRFASAADAAADELHPDSLQNQALQQVAHSLEDFASKMKDSDIETLTASASEFARKNPLLFVGGAAFAGFLVTRFLKAKDPEPSMMDAGDDDVWASLTPASGHADHEAVLAQMDGGHQS